MRCYSSYYNIFVCGNYNVLYQQTFFKIGTLHGVSNTKSNVTDIGYKGHPLSLIIFSKSKMYCSLHDFPNLAVLPKHVYLKRI
jgi:hypothetical protein